MLPLNGHRHNKTCFRGFRQSETQTSLLSYRNLLENWNFACYKFRYDIFQKVNKKVSISLCWWAGWSAPLLFANNIKTGFCIKAYIVCYMRTYVVFLLQANNPPKSARQSLNSKWTDTHVPLYPSNESLLLSPETPVSIQAVKLVTLLKTLWLSHTNDQFFVPLQITR